MQGEVITRKYWDELAEEVDATLQAAGQLAMSELARRFNLGAELLLGVIQERMGTLVSGTLGLGRSCSSGTTRQRMLSVLKYSSEVSSSEEAS